jgi:uncharacterized protein YkwD
MLAGCLLALAVAAGSALESSAVAAAPTEQQQARQLLVKFRTARNDAKRRVGVIEEIVAAGPEAVGALADVLDKDLARLEAAVPAGPDTKAYDEQVAALRKILADLRNDPNLSKEQTEKIGLPALDQLTAVWKLREAVVNAHFLKLTKTAAQVEQLDGLFKQLEEKWKDEASPPLPVSAYRDRSRALLARATPNADEEIRQVYIQNAELAMQLDRDAVAGMNGVNAMRVMCGLRPLVFDPKLCQTGVDHSADMESHGFFAHESPVEGKKTPWDRAKRFGTTASGENIYMGSNVSVDAIKAWFLSPGHHKNMLGDGHKRQGLGRTGRYWTQLFGA